MQLHQVLVSATPGDAVTAFALELQKLLRRIAPSEIFARNVHPGLWHDVHELDKYFLWASMRPRDDVLLYHASIGEPQVHGFVMDRPERVVLVYHNISPAESFVPYEPGFAGLLELGRRNLGLLRDRVTAALAVSAFNAAELTALGYADVRVSPLIIDPAALHDVELDEGTTHHLDQMPPGPIALFVGQVLPHKRPELLVQAFHALATYLDPDAHLILVGRQGLPRFARAVQQQIVELGLHRAWMTGAVPPETLRSFYERADLFVTASDHEGFCVPLLEAMSFGLPVIARGTTAIPETVGGAGVVVPPDDSPLVFAEAWSEVIGNEPLRRELIDRGTARLRAFDADGARRTFLEHMESIL